MVKKARVTREREVRLYQNEFLESLTRVHPALPIAIWGPVAVAFIYLGHLRGLSVGTVVALSIFGAFAWTLVEYCLHRWIFHWEPRRPTLKKFFYPLHQLHHDVQEWDRLLAPPMMAVPLYLILMGVGYWILGTPTLFPFWGGFTIGYLCYDYIHFYTHFVKPKNRIGVGLRKRHLQHHFSAEERWYGVSSPLWDYVFRTHVPRGQRPFEATSRTK